jgi:hypothetical protein
MSAQRVARALMALTFAVAITTVGIVISQGGSFSEVTGGGMLVPGVALPVLGALVIRQRGSHIVGWLILGMGLSLALEGFWEHWAQVALVDDPGSLPLGDFASWMQAWGWIPGWVLATTLLPVVFPDGQPVGRRRLLAWIDTWVVVALAIGIAAASWHLRGPLLLSDSASDPRAATLDHIASIGIAVTGILAIVSIGSLAARFRRATPDVRRQIAWAAYGAAVAVFLAVAGAFLDLGAPFHAIQASAFTGGIAIAMLRYRLYDIDVVINRTLVYGALTATLAGCYLGVVLLLQLVLNGVTQGSGLAVATSTLAVAALFRPARARIQAAVDRRFYRRKYDAQRTLESFSARLRDEVALDALSAELRVVVGDAMQPAHVSLWLRGPVKVP